MNTVAALLFCAVFAIMACEVVAFESVAERTGGRANARAKPTTKTCRCTFRNAPQKLMNAGTCDQYGQVYADNNQNNIGVCQKDAKNTAPEACRQYYGHCGWLQ